MGRYLFKVSYTADGLRGVLKEGGQSRSDFVHHMASEMGGSVESFDFAFGDTDCYVLCEMEGDETAAAVAMAVSASGAASVETVKLLTPAQVDAARGITANYRPPGA